MSTSLPSTRPFLLCHLPTSARVSFPVPAIEPHWTGAEISREAFNLWLELQSESPLNLILQQQQQPASIDDQDDDLDSKPSQDTNNNTATEASLILLSHFLEFSASRPSEQSLTLAALSYFHQSILDHNTIDPHNLAKVQTSSEQARQQIIRSYYLARTSLENCDGLPEAVVGRLWRDEMNKKVVGVFGGQGVNETYWDELVVSLRSTSL